MTSEGQRDSAINSAQGQAQARVLDAEAMKKAAILQAEADQQAIVLRAEAEQQEQVLKAEATAQALQIVTEKLKSEPKAREALQYILAQSYLDMGRQVGSSDSSKVMFMDPRSMISTIEGMRAVISNRNDNGEYTPVELDLDKLDRDR